MSVKIFLLFGRSGCGKGTQGKLLAKKFGLTVYGSGNLLRARAQKDDFSGKKLKKVLAKGVLAPTSLIYKEWANKFDALKKDKNFKGMILDGSPRKEIEADLLNQAFEWYEWKNVYRILIDISRKEAQDRLLKRRICRKCDRIFPWIGEFKKLEKCDQCGGELERRGDDEVSAIKERLDYYEKEVVPMIEYYEKRSELITVSGEQEIEKVFEDILSESTNKNPNQRI